jgi:endonuclease G, mitochondrial
MAVLESAPHWSASMTFDLNVATKAAERWQARTRERASKEAALKAGRITEVETPDRIRKRLEHLAAAAMEAQTARPPSNPQGNLEVLGAEAPFLVERVGLERVMGKRDFLGINFLELALAVSRFVGRIHIRQSPGRTAGFGTGFMVSPRLLLTNNHVLGAKSDAIHSEVEFDYQNDRSGRPLPVVVYGLEPETFFLTDQELDYTLIAVKERSVQGNIALKLYGWNRLNEQQGKALLGDSLNIIQHPNGEAKQIVLRSNQLVDLLPTFAHYVTDTEPGSSGSPVYNDQWEPVALHHSGVPKVQDGNWIAKDGSIWKSGMDPDTLEWVANEGIRVSALVGHIKQQTLTRSQARLREEMLSAEPPHPIETAAQAAAAGDKSRRSFVALPPGLVGDDVSTWTIPLEVTVRVGTPTRGSPQQSSGRTPQGRTQQMTPTDTIAPHLSSVALQNALAELEAAPTREYYSEAADRHAREIYYKDLPSTATPEQRFDGLSDLLQRTHFRPLPYQPAVHVYPWVDLHEAGPRPSLKSIYSGKDVDPRDFIREDFRIDAERERLAEMLRREAKTSLSVEAHAALLEATLPYNCEHVVPQSWFNKREPMRGDLHHLFACETDCNTFRGNLPFFDFEDFEEGIRDACGKQEVDKFEPSAGKGAVARATLYFMLRYPGEINRTSREYTVDRLDHLLRWHKHFGVTRYEQHRNAAIFDKQGNRNPLIDFPEWAETIDFARGLGK